jgi:antibiotic biosynthesis monooxygenase (ABM) superfamily enzyme
MKQPSRYKMAVLIWLAVYPLSNLIFLVMGAWINALPLYLKTLVISFTLVPLMVFVALPLLQTIFKKWLNS